VDDSQQNGRGDNSVEIVIGVVLIAFSAIAAFALLHDQFAAVFGR
jgi:hypothetical protein